MRLVPFNLNDRVRVRLNERGWAIYRLYYKKYRPAEDAEGRIAMPAWEMAAIFGPHLGAGMEIPFVRAQAVLEVKDDLISNSDGNGISPDTPSARSESPA